MTIADEFFSLPPKYRTKKKLTSLIKSPTKKLEEINVKKIWNDIRNDKELFSKNDSPVYLYEVAYLEHATAVCILDIQTKINELIKVINSI